MRLLFVSTAFPQPGDPARAPYNLRLCEALAEHHAVRVISPVSWTKARAGAPRPSTPVRVDYPTFLYPPGVLRSTHGWWLWRALRTAAAGVLAQGRPDAIVSYWTWPDGAAAARLARACVVPAIMIVGGSDVLVRGTHGRNRRRIARTLQQADAVITVGPQLADAVAALGVQPARISVVPRGVDRQVFSPGRQASARRRLGLPPFGSLLLWVGRLCAVKGPDLLLDALEPHARRGLRWHCAIVGDGPMRRELERRVEGGALRDSVSFVGTLPPVRLADWYRAADAVVLSSRSEGVPNVVYEARACGTPVVAMNAGDVAQAMDRNDWLVPAGDVDALAAALCDAMARPRLSRPPAALPTWQDSAAALARIIERVRAVPGTSAPAAPALRPASTTRRA